MSKFFRNIRRGISSQISAFYESAVESCLGMWSALKKIPEAIGDFFSTLFFKFRITLKTLRRLPKRMVKGTGDFFWTIADNLGVQFDSLKTLKRPFTLIRDLVKFLIWATGEGFRNLATITPRLPKLVFRAIKASVIFVFSLPVFLVTSAVGGTVAGIKAMVDGLVFLKKALVETFKDMVSLPGQVVEQRRKIIRRLTSRLALLAATGLVLAGGALAGAKFIALPAYREWKQDRLLVQARDYFENEDIRGAILTTHQILRTNYNNIGANRLMAEIGERIGTNEALTYRERVSILDPTDFENRLQWASHAAQTNRFEEARKALQDLPESLAGDPRRLWTSFQIASGENNQAEAREALQTLLRVDPEHGDAAFELLLADLKGGNPLAAERARMELARIARSEDPHHLRARREVILDDLRQGLMIEAIPLAQMIRDNPESSFFDRLLALTTLRRTGFRIDHANYLKELQDEAKDDPRKAFMLAELMMRNRDFSQLVAWSGSFSPEVRQAAGVQFQVSEALLQSRSWQQLEQYLRPLDWRGANFRKHAKLARAYREMERTGSFETEWRLALTSVRTAPQLRELLEMIRDWGWTQETESLIWTAIDRFPNETWPTNEIFNDALESGRSESIARILEELVRRNPADVFARNDLARLHLLQHRRTEEAHATALRLHSQVPDNLRITITYALSLHMQGRTADAVALFDSFSKDQIRQNGPASLYYGLLLAFAGQQSEANEFLDNLPADLSTLPEEKRLIREARDLLASS